MNRDIVAINLALSAEGARLVERMRVVAMLKELPMTDVAFDVLRDVPGAGCV